MRKFFPVCYLLSGYPLYSGLQTSSLKPDNNINSITGVIMKNLSSTLSAFLIITVLCVFSAYAQLSGPLSGAITAGTYTIEGNIYVPSGYSLTLEPGGGI